MFLVSQALHNEATMSDYIQVAASFSHSVGEFNNRYLLAFQSSLNPSCPEISHLASCIRPAKSYPASNE